MGYSGFQGNSFQRNAYQIMGAETPSNDGIVLLGGKAVFGQWPGIQGHGYDDPEFHKLLTAQYDRLNEIQKEIDKKSKINDNVVEVTTFDAKKADALYQDAVARAQQIKQLINEKAALMRLLDDNEAILVLMLSQPFCH